MNRRDFVKKAGIAGGALSALHGLKLNSLANVRPASANSRIQVALIGARNMGGRTHLPSMVGSDLCQVVAICDVDSKIRQEFIDKASQQYAEQTGVSKYEGIEGYEDYRDLLNNDKIDAVVMATPDHWHVPMSKDFIKAKKDVYVEKPVSLFVTEGRELMDIVDASDQILQIGSQQRSSDRFMLAVAAVKSGLLGKIEHVDVFIRTRGGSAEPWTPQPVPPELNYDLWHGPVLWTDYHPRRVHYDFRFVPEFSGGDITNWGAHFLDSAQQILSLDDTGPTRVWGAGRSNPPGSLHTSYYGINVDYEFEDGLTMNLKSDNENGIQIHGENGRLFVNRNTLELRPEGLLKEIPRDIVDAQKHTRGSHLNNWFECILSRKKEHLHASIHVGHRSAILCHLANIAIELERELHWDAKREHFINDTHANAMLSRPQRTGY